MSTLTDAVTRRPRSRSGFVVIPVAEYKALLARAASRDLRATIPHDVVSAMVDGASAARAWREHLGLTQAAVARRLGISQSALAQVEAARRPRRSTCERLAAALGIGVEQLAVRPEVSLRPQRRRATVSRSRR